MHAVHLGLLVGQLGLEHPPLDLGDALLLVEAAHALLPRVELGGVAQLALVRAWLGLGLGLGLG